MTAKSSNVPAGWLLLALAVGLALHAAFCSRSPFFDEDIPHSSIAWGGAVGYSVAGATISMTLGLICKIFPGLHDRWLVPLVIGLYLGLTIRVANRFTGGLLDPTNYAQRSTTTRDSSYNTGNIRYHSDAGRYTATFPNDPTLVTSETPWEHGTIRSFHAEAEVDGMYYAVVYKDIPDKLLALGENAVLLSFRAAALREVGATASDERTHTFGQYACQDMRMNSTNPDASFIADCRMILAEERLYQLIVVADQTLEKKRVEAFFESFSIDR